MTTMPASPLTQVGVLTGRSLLGLRDPRMIVMNLLQPMIMLTLFSQVFKTMANAPGFPAGIGYLDYLMPAILVTTGAQAAVWAGGGLANDLKNGVLARFRTLPVTMVAVVSARSLFDLVRSALQLLTLLVAAMVLFGFDPPGGVLGSLGALVLALVVGTGLGAVFMALAAWVKNGELLQTIGMATMFPLMFASSAFVPVGNLPGWLRAVAVVNPLTYAVDAARGFSLGAPAWQAFVSALAVSTVLLVAGLGLAAGGVRRP